MTYAGASLLWLLLIQPEIVPPYIGGLFRAVVIDAGHGGKDRGAAGHGLVEKNLTLDVATRLADRLSRRGLQVVMSREDDTYMSLAERVRVGADQRLPSLFLSLHFNYASHSAASGLETYYFDLNEEIPADLLGEFAADESAITESKRLAAMIQAALVRHTGAIDRGVKNRGFFVLRHARLPAVLIEGGFVTNRDEAALIAQPAYRQRLAEAIEEGLMEYRNELRRLRHAARQAGQS